MSAPYSAYVPCYNDAATLRRAVESVLAQTPAPAEVLVVDDASTDGSARIVADLPVRLIRHEKNLGRGATRRRALHEARHDLVLGCDAGLALGRGFSARALAGLQDPRIAALFGSIGASAGTGVADRWRDRHVFKVDQRPSAVQHGASLQTGGCLLRRSVVAAVGGFDPAKRRAEDADLGNRLLVAGHDVVHDPALSLIPLASDSIHSALARYWRWNHAPAGHAALRGYWSAIGYSWRVMIAHDRRAHDWPAAALSLACPHYCALRSLFAG